MTKPKKKPKPKPKVERQPKRKLGIYQGKVIIPDDFDAPLPKEILDAFEGKDQPEEDGA